MTGNARWALLATYATGFDAELAKARLEDEDIPVLIKGPQVGVFGAGFQGVMGGGLELFVPSPELDRARELLAD
ncbi:MAG: putative signal transducing protein [Gemmatimonadaceae bacterium]